jgi:hypothetical protein
MNVKSTFLNGRLKEEVYIQQSSVVDDSESKVLRLRNALYGLREASRAWNGKLNDTMSSLGFQRSSSEHGIYTRSIRGGRLIVIICVDNLIIVKEHDERKGGSNSHTLYC